MPTPENPLVVERPESPTIPEKLQQATGVTPAPVSVQQVKDDKGNPIIVTPTAVSTKIQLPGSTKTLISWSKGKVVNALTWLGRFFLRLIAKENYANKGDE